MKTIIECKMNNYASMKNKDNRQSKTQAIANTKKFVPRFEPLLYIPTFTIMKDFTII